jgi:hypothetical protein
MHFDETKNLTIKEYVSNPISNIISKYKNKLKNNILWTF